MKFVVIILSVSTVFALVERFIKVDDLSNQIDRLTLRETILSSQRDSLKRKDTQNTHLLHLYVDSLEILKEIVIKPVLLRGMNEADINAAIRLRINAITERHNHTQDSGN